MVYISFVVEEDGSISSVKLVRGIGGGCDEVAIEAIRSMPKWKSQMWKGKPQSLAMVIPVLFRLSE